MIKEIPQAEFGPFFDLMGEVEAGRHFDSGKPEHTGWLTGKIAKEYARGVRFFGIYDDDGSPRGLIGLYIEDYLNIDWRLGFITHAGTFRGYRGVGYGSKLLEFAAEEAKRQNCYCLYVDTYAGNPGNVRFYVLNGFVPVATIPDMNGPGDEGQVCLRKILDTSSSE